LQPETTVSIKFYERGFYELCERSRRDKKPILIVELRDENDESILTGIENLKSETIQEFIDQTYNVYGLFRSRLDRTLLQVLELPE
jgi:hypothetical protein